MPSSALRPSTAGGSPLKSRIDARAAVPALLAIFTIAWAWLGTSWPALLVGVGLMFAALPSSLGWLRRLVLTGMIYTGYGLVMGTLFSFAGLALPPGLFITVFTGAAAALAYRFADWRLSATAGDAAIAIVFLGSAWLAVRWGLGQTTDQLILQLSRGGDNANHMNLVRVIQQGEGYQYQTGIFGLLGGMEFYPQGFAFLTAYTGWLADGIGQVPTVAQTVNSSWFLFAFQPALAVGFILLAVRGLLLRGGSKAVGIPLFLAGLAVAAVVLLMIYANLATFGFQTQMFAMNATIAAVWIATDPAITNRALRLLGVSVGVVAVAGSWFLLAPPAIFVAAVVAWPLIRRPRSAPKGTWTWLAPALVLLAFSAWYPVHRSTPDTAGHLTMSGGVRLFDERLWKTLAVVAVVVLAFEFRRLLRSREPGQTPVLPVLVGVILTALALSAGVARFQLDESGELSYYFFKTLYLPVALGVIMLGLGIARVAAEAKISEYLTDWRKVVATVVLIPCALILTTLTHDLWKPYTKEAPRGPIDAGVMAGLLQAYPYGLPQDKDYIATAYCSYLESGQITSWIGGLFTSWDAARQKFYLSVDGPRSEAPANVVRYIEDSPGREITVYLQTSCEISRQTLQLLPPWVPVIDRESHEG
ncbi:hypothetical protein D1871_06080 [Nakamurella silvestris]|nr:hypothetical protein D1871_06080 [Nakamurella silvestris]